MFSTQNWLKLSVMVMLAGTVVGCGPQGFKSAGNNGLQVMDVSEELRKADEANQIAIAAINEAYAVVADITDEKGNINIGLFSKNASNQEVQSKLFSGLTDKLREVLDKVFARAEIVKAKFAEARMKLMEALAKLDQNNPAQAALIQEIMSRMAQIDAMESKFRGAMVQLTAKLDLAMDGLDKLISGVTSFIPGWGWVVDLALDFLIMSDIKALISDLKMKLLSL